MASFKNQIERILTNSNQFTVSDFMTTEEDSASTNKTEAMKILLELHAYRKSKYRVV
jgi:hypothetical protein